MCTHTFQAECFKSNKKEMYKVYSHTKTATHTVQTWRHISMHGRQCHSQTNSQGTQAPQVNSSNTCTKLIIKLFYSSYQMLVLIVICTMQQEAMNTQYD